MKRFPPPPWPVIETGLASAVLGSVAAILMLLPIICIPLSGIGLLFGVIGTLVARGGYPTSLRIAVAGTVLCGAVLSCGVLVYFAPRGEAPSRAVPRPWQQPPYRPTVPPPARD